MHNDSAKFNGKSTQKQITNHWTNQLKLFLQSTRHNIRHPPTKQNQPTTTRRMSMFFFRLHNLQRAEENKRKKRVEQQRQQQRQRRGAKVFKCVSDSTGHLTLAPSRLFERTPMSPSDSLDEIALQIPRWVESKAWLRWLGYPICGCQRVMFNLINTFK